MRNFIYLLSVCLLAAVPASAELFTSSDQAFTLDMPSGWKRVKNPPQNGVLSLEKKEARIDIKKITCTTETCLDKQINRDVAEVKSKKMALITNTYTGEEIKRFEFSTGEPLYYINFYTPQNDFSAGYFLINGQGYSILAKNMTYAETDLVFSFISPLAKSAMPALPALDGIAEEDLLPGYTTQAVPEVEVESLDEFPLSQAGPAEPPAPAVAPQAPAGKFQQLRGRLQALWAHNPVHTLVTPQMPPYIRQLGRGYDVLIGLILVFFMGWCGAGIGRLFIRPKHMNLAANPNSLYPIKLERRYGTPSLILRAKDNQGNVLTALSVRWDALFMFFGIVIMLLALLMLAATSISQQLRLLPLSAFAYSTLYSAGALIFPLGFVIFFCGIVWGQLAMNEITLYDNRGRKAAVLLQKGYSLTQERYQIYFARSKELLLARRKRFGLRRQWKLLSKDQVEFATITERSAGRAIVRMLCGHLWGLLRADYDITGAMDSRGAIENTHGLFNRSVCNIDKPEAIPARDMLAVSLLISIRDRDKWYPWFN